MVRNLTTRVRKNKSKGKKMQTRKRTTTKKGGKKQTKQNKKHKKKQGGRKTYKKRGGDNGDSGNMGEQNIDEILGLQNVKGDINLWIKRTLNERTLTDLHNSYNLEPEALNDDDLKRREEIPQKILENLRIELGDHIFGDRKPKKLERIAFDTLLKLKHFKGTEDDTLFTPETYDNNKGGIDNYFNHWTFNNINRLNKYIDTYNERLKELKLVKTEPNPEPQPRRWF